MLPAKFIELWEVVDRDSQDMEITSPSDNRYLLSMVDKATRFLCAYPTKTKEADVVANYPLDLCLAFGTPAYIRSDRRGKFNAEVFNHICRWLNVDINYGPADNPRGKDAVERVRTWTHDVLSEPCKSSKHWDNYVGAAC